MIIRPPLAFPRQRIGLFGGSFDPAHEGHTHVAETALKRLRLDQVWWLVTPQNPLKAQSAPLQTRIASAKARARGPRMRVTGFEAAANLRFTYQTVRALQRRYPETYFILIVGGDTLQNFRHWRRWRDVLTRVPLAIVARPGFGSRVRHVLPVQLFARHRKPQDAARVLTKAPAWTFLNAHAHPVSSTQLRASGRKAGAHTQS